MDTIFKIAPVSLENFPWIQRDGRAIENATVSLRPLNNGEATLREYQFST